MITIDNLAFRYTDSEFALTVPQLQIAKGEKVAFVGPSGCGKTTLISLIAGIYQPQSGAIRIEECEISALNDASRRRYRLANIGFIFQQFELIEYLDVCENILLPIYLNSDQPRSPEIAKRAVYLAQQVGLGDKLRRRPQQLSQGEKQRIAIARALINEPRLIIADEPTGNLDPDTTKIIIQLILKQVSVCDASFLMVTHDHSLLGSFDRILSFNNGSIDEVSKPELKESREE